MDNEEKIAFAIRGPAVEGSFRLDVYNDILVSYQQILDRSFLAAVGKKRMMQSERELFSTKVVKWERGSILIDLAVAAVPIAQAYIDSKTSQPHFLTMSEIIEFTYKFLKARIEQAAKTGKEPLVQITNSPNAQVILNIGGGKIEVSQNLVDAANLTEPHYKKLTSHIDGEGITEISSWSGQERGVSLNVDDNKFFNPTTEIDDRVQLLSGKIFRFDVESASGRLRVVDSDAIPIGTELRFVVTGKQALDSYIDALHSTVKYSEIQVLREIVRHPSGTITIAALHATKLLKSQSEK
ncbi:MAG: hypothetical protein ABL860_09985 [Candidatus Nitrotoga sp.]